MKNTKSLCLDESSEVIRPPAFPVRGCKIFAKLRARMASDYDKGSLKLDRLSTMIGIPVSTSHDWFCVSKLSQVSALLCMIERLPEDAWCQVIRSGLRDFPSLRHSRLAWDYDNVARLEALTQAKNGITVIRGGSDAERTFVITALGHSFQLLDPLQRMIMGIDVHEPRNFVPLESVLYIRELVAHARLQEIVLDQWPTIRNAKAPCLVFNGIASAVPNLIPSILELAERRHVILADSVPVKASCIAADTLALARVVEILPTQGRSSRIKVAVR